MSKKWILTASSLIVIGFLGLLFTKFDISNDNSIPFEHEWEFENTVLNTIDIKGTSSNIDIKFITSNTNDTVIKIEGETEVEIYEEIKKASLIDGHFKLNAIAESPIRWLSFGLEKNNIAMTIAIPEAKKISHFNLVTSSGRINIQHLKAVRANIKSSSGLVQIENSTINDLITDASSGHIRFTKHSGNIAATVTSGYIKIDQVQGNSEVKSTSGKIEVEQYAIGNMTLISTSGSIRATQHITGNASIKTTSGKIKMKLGEQFGGTIHSNTKSGKISGPEKGWGGDRPTSDTIELKTTSGNISITPNK